LSAETLFSLASAAVTPGWLLLVFAPRWRWTARLVAPVLIPAMLAVLYVTLLIVHMPGAQGGFGSLAEVQRLFASPWLLLAGWVHYLAFDLFIGSWQVRDAQRHGIRHLLVVPCLVPTFLFGPAGLLLYFAIRTASKRRVAVDELT